ncbi:hypothetical protein F0562_006509 [Nyssa sinensis]|uniref:Uncharacterized protein n=1 Tax=Nyssa sinensis TaxID=561372 RepID=A0A5J5AN98_9ASTE|nr:hypothetical protein F0562_006509 [Nyssa sinensis]
MTANLVIVFFQDRYWESTVNRSRSYCGYPWCRVFHSIWKRARISSRACYKNLPFYSSKGPSGNCIFIMRYRLCT